MNPACWSCQCQFLFLKSFLDQQLDRPVTKVLILPTIGSLRFLAWSCSEVSGEKWRSPIFEKKSHFGYFWHFRLKIKKMAKNPQKWYKIAYKKKLRFFSKIGLRHFSPLTSEQLHAKNLRDPMVGSMRTFVTDRRDRRDGTDGGYFKGPNCWSKKTTCPFPKSQCVSGWTKICMYDYTTVGLHCHCLLGSVEIIAN